jgi:exportin-5
MRDSRCCGVVLRVFRSIIPDFAASDDSQFSSQIREFISTDVLQACISSLTEPYFVELQKDLAQVIASIMICYSQGTETPRQILLSLPGIDQASVDKCISYMMRQGVHQRQQRALVLDLLRDLKGVSISEQGRITKPVAVVRKERSKMQQEFMKEQPATVENGHGHGHGQRQTTPNLDGVAGMFDGE